MQASFLRFFLEHIDEWNRGRREAAARYAELGLGELVELPQDEPGHIYHLFVCRSPERDAIRAALTEAGIASAAYYTTPLHLQPALRFLGYEPGSLPETERAALENFSVPLWPGIPVDAQERVVDAVALRGRRRLPGMSWLEPSPAAGSCWSTRAIVAVAWVLAFELRFDHGLPVYYDDAAAPDAADRRRDQARGVHRVRLLQPLVALRVGARHVERSRAASSSRASSPT